MNIPNYILENFSPEQLSLVSYTLPKYAMIKFRGKDSNIDQSYNIFKIGLNSKEWNVIWINLLIDKLYLELI